MFVTLVSGQSVTVTKCPDPSVTFFSFFPNNSTIILFFFSPKGRYFPKYFVLLQMQPSRLRMIEAKDIRLRTIVLERTDRDEVVHILLIVRYISYD